MGAPRRPPFDASNAARKPRNAASTTSGPGVSPAGAPSGASAARTPSTSDLVAAFTRSASRAQTSAISRRIDRKPRAAPRSPSLRREVRPAEERLLLRREPDAHRPPAAAGEELHRGHVQPVDVGPLLAVDLDGHVPLVQDARDLLVLEGLALHDVAPVTGRVADGEEHRAAAAARLVERLVPPRPPAHRVVRVLEEVRALLEDETIGEPRPPGVEVVRARRVAGPSGANGVLEAQRERLREGLRPGQPLDHVRGLMGAAARSRSPDLEALRRARRAPSRCAPRSRRASSGRPARSPRWRPGHRPPARPG